jgi:hypothetical protein
VARVVEKMVEVKLAQVWKSAHPKETRRDVEMVIRNQQTLESRVMIIDERN